MIGISLSPTAAQIHAAMLWLTHCPRTGETLLPHLYMVDTLVGREKLYVDDSEVVHDGRLPSRFGTMR